MKPFNSILYVVEDPSNEPATAVARVVSLARNNQATLAVLHVADEPRLGPFAGRLTQDDFKMRIREQALAQLKEMLRSEDRGLNVAVEVRFGAAFVEVVREVLRNGHDLVIKQVGKGGAHSFLFGGTDQHLLRKCPCPVWIMVGDTSANYQRVLAALDFDPWGEGNEKDEVEVTLNRKILDIAASLSITDFAQLHVVHAWEPITDRLIRVFGSELSADDVARNRDLERREHQSRLDTLARKMQKQFGEETHEYLAPRFHLRSGPPRDVVPALAKALKADLVVMGTVSRTGIPGFLIGNTAEVILNNLECAVLAVKPSGFVTPVTLE